MKMLPPYLAQRRKRGGYSFGRALLKVAMGVLGGAAMAGEPLAPATPQTSMALGGDDISAWKDGLSQILAKHFPAGVGDGLLGKGGADGRLLGMFYPITLPPAFTIVLWTQSGPEKKGDVLFGLGDLTSGSLMLTRDEAGAPTLLLCGKKNDSAEMVRAQKGAANLNDGKLHSIAIIVDRGKGLVLVYVDGQAESAAATQMNIPVMTVGRAFWESTVQGLRSDSRGSSPLIVNRALTDEELAVLTLGAGRHEDGRRGQIAKARTLRSMLWEDTLASFPLDMLLNRTIRRPALQFTSNSRLDAESAAPPQ